MTNTQTSTDQTPNAIEDSELLQLQKIRDKVKEASKLVKQLKDEEEELDAYLLEKIKAGATFTGRLRAIIDTVKGRCNPKWKDEYVLHFAAEHGQMASEVEERIKAKYPAQDSETVVVAVEKKK